MAIFYKIINEDNNRSVKSNSYMILNTIKALKNRNPTLCQKWIDAWEELEGKKFDWNFIE